MSDTQPTSGFQPLQLLRSQDLDEARHLVASVFCEHHLSLNGKQRLDYRHAHQRTGRLSFSQMSYGTDVTVAPDGLDNFYLVQLPISGSDRQKLNGREVLNDHRHATVQGPGDALEMNWSADCRKLVVRFDRGALEQHAASLFGRSLNKPLQFHPLMHLDHPACIAWRNSALHTFNELQRAPQVFELPLIREQLEQTLMTTLLTWQPHDLRHQLASSPRVLPRHVKLACDYMQAHADCPVTVERLAELTGVSGRSLFAGFDKFLGLTPMRYLRDLRLERVRQDLLDPRQPRSVTEVATRWGFFQLGRMAVEYRKRYGESPRDTLLRARQ